MDGSLCEADICFLARGAVSVEKGLSWCGLGTRNLVCTSDLFVGVN